MDEERGSETKERGTQQQLLRRCIGQRISGSQRDLNSETPKLPPPALSSLLLLLRPTITNMTKQRVRLLDIYLSIYLS